MAYWYRKRGKAVTVYYMKDGTETQLPREKTRHLDSESDEEIDKWVARWARLNEAYASRPELRPPSPQLDRLMQDYTAYLSALGRRPNTVDKHDDKLRKIASYFGDLPLDKWRDRSWDLAAHLRGEGDSPEAVRRTYQTLRRFWEWLENTGHVEGTLRIPRLPAPRKAKTPLRRLLLPDEVLEFARSTQYPDAKFLALAGYFFSLRTQETIGLLPRDFVAGSEAAKLECCRVMRAAGLYDRLAVWVCRQKARDAVVGVKGEEEYNEDNGEHVACFNADAAALLVGMLNEGYEGFQNSAGYSTKFWRKKGIKGVTLKDLRRASLYYLGHETQLRDIALMNHARHESFDTTRFYLRRPGGSQQATKKKFDLDD